MGQLLLVSLQLFSLFTALDGLYFILFTLDNGLFANIHNSVWFLFSSLSNGFGILAILSERYETRGESGSVGHKTLMSLQYHYFFSWINILVGYAGLVTQTWLAYYPLQLSHVHLALIGAPIVAWLKRKSSLVVLSTQLVTGLAILSHLYISIDAWNLWGLCGSVLMGLIVIAMSLPIRYTFFSTAFSTREAGIMLSGMASYAFAASIQESAQFHRNARKIFS